MEFLPVVRLPWRTQEGCTCEAVRKMIVDDFIGVSGYSLPKTVVFKSYKLGCLKLILMSSTFFMFVLYQGMYVDKEYLKVYPIDGDMRMQLQHPVNHCNPLHDDCESNFRSFEDLPYCKQSGKNKDVKQELCEDMDEYEVPAQAFPSSKILIPTRKTTLKQKQLCSTTEPHCNNRYDLIGAPTTTYSADVENFTLLLDHAFICEGLGKEASAWELVGFLRPCGPPHDCPLLALSPVDKYKDSAIDDKFYERAKFFFDVHEEVPKKEAFRLPNGDVFRVGYLLDLMGIDLDGKNDWGETIREEGLSMMLEVHYTNFKAYTRPNKMPIVYEYRFTKTAFQTYKATETHRDIAGKERHVMDTHGIAISSRQTGRIGDFSIRCLLLMLLEASLLIGIMRWFVSFVSVNWWKGENGDMLETIADTQVDIEIIDEMAGTMKLVKRGKKKMSVVDPAGRDPEYNRLGEQAAPP